jgi:hypothetical protein
MGTPPAVLNRIRHLLYDITLVFGPANHGSTNYKFGRRQNLRAVSAYVIEFENRKGTSASTRGGPLVGLRDTRIPMNGKGWVDPSSMQVLRIEMSEDPSAPGKEDTVLDYGAVVIDGKAYWLLNRLSKKNDAIEWTVEYTECRKFEVTTEIRPVQ